MARKLEDLSGRRFGAWLVLRRVANTSRHVTYLCRCDCGAEVPVIAGNLRSERSTQCRGCATRNRERTPRTVPTPKPPAPKGPEPEDLTGRKYNEWTVLYFVGLTPSRQRLWKCQCSCGIKALVQAGNLKSGMSKSCRPCGGRRSAQTRWSKEKEQE